MRKSEIIVKINEYIAAKEKQIIEKRIDSNSLTFVNLRDRLIGFGKILEESFEQNYYIVNVPAGIANKNAAVVLILWSKDEISMFAYAKEGLISQHTADKAIDKIVDRIRC